MKPKWIFIVFWTLILILPIATVLYDTPDLHFIFSAQSSTITFFSRIAGLMALTLLPIQIILGSYMNKLADRFGAWIFKWHITQAILVYGLVITHPVLQVLGNIPMHGIDPFYVFTDFCGACRTHQELFLTFGRIAFWFITMTYFAAKFRTQPFLQRNWHTIHRLNYVMFFLVSAHAFFLGPDTLSKVYVWYYILANIVVLILASIKLKKLIKSNFF